MKPCCPFAVELDLLAAGVLPLERARAVESHLAGCAACRGRYERMVVLCAELSTASQPVEPPDAAVWRLRRRVQVAITAPAPAGSRRWQAGAALAAGAVCVALLAYQAVPPVRRARPVQASSVAPSADNPPLTLLACERAAARSDAALALILSQDSDRPCAGSGERTLRAFSPATFTALDRDDQIP